MRWTSACCGFGCFLLCASAAADGLFFHPVLLLPEEVGTSKRIVASPRQEAILVRKPGEVEVTLRTYYRAGPAELAWFVPVPQAPTKVEKADEAVFRALDECSRPRFFHFVVAHRLNGGFGCGCSAGPMFSEQVPAGTIRIEGAGTAGIFDYTVLSAGDVQTLVRWLEDRKYAIPAGAGPVLQRYVDAHWHWLAIRLRSEQTKEAVLAPHPIRYTYVTDESDASITFPLIISRPAADAENEILLYVVDASPENIDRPARYRCENWENVEIDNAAIKANSDSPSGTNYESLFREAVRSHAFITECAEKLSDPNRPGNVSSAALKSLMGEKAEPVYVTRLRTIITPDQMDRDVVLVPADNARDVSCGHDIAAVNHAGNDSDIAGAAIVFGLPLVCCCLLRRRSVCGRN